MSTLQVETIKNPTSSNTVNSEQVIQGSATAWVNFDGTGTVAIRDSYNVSSITDISVGNYTVNFTTNMINVNYGVINTVNAEANVFRTTNGIAAQTTSGYTVAVKNISGTNTDEESVYVATFGGL